VFSTFVYVGRDTVCVWWGQEDNRDKDRRGEFYRGWKERLLAAVDAFVGLL